MNTNSNKKNSDNKEPMNILIALDILEISLDDVKITDLTKDYIKKKYHKMALLWHPDKNNDEDSTHKFQKINDAYEYLSNVACINIDNSNLNAFEPFVSSSSFKESKVYSNILSGFISSIIKGDYKEGLMHIVKEIVLNYDTISVGLFEDLDKQSAVEIYTIIQKYKDILYISDKTLELVSSIIKEKYKNDKVFILNPNIDDLWNNKIYKLYVNEKLYLVPLWHNELYFECEDGSEIIAMCQPKLPQNVTIDENNNIYCRVDISIHNELEQFIKENKFVSCIIGEKCFSVPISRLYLKEDQLYRFKGKGISKICDNDMYNISTKSDVIIRVVLL